MAANSATITDIAGRLERWAPAGSAQSYDNVGLQVGDASRTVSRAVVALDCTHEVIEEARRRDAELIITHHPLIFKPLESVTAGAGPAGIAFELAASGLALYSIHTNLDAARDGVSFALAEQLGLEDIDFMAGFPDALYKLVTFVPEANARAVHEALSRAGGGRIGNYEACAFRGKGTGHFRALEGSNPAVGSADGELESVEEVRLEMEIPRWSKRRILGALREAHPYEEVAYDLYPVEQPYTNAGLGAAGNLPSAEPLSDFLGRTADALGAESLRYAGDPDASVERVAVCGGAGSSFVGAARRTGADAYVTADVTYHTFFDVLGADGKPEMAFIDAGHYETEAITEQLLVDFLSDEFPSIDFQRTSARTSPMRTFVP